MLDTFRMREELNCILDTFPIVRRRKDEERYGEYRTKRMVLESYDALEGIGPLRRCESVGTE